MRPKPPPMYIDHSPFGPIHDSWTATSLTQKMIIIQRAVHKVAILRAYFYGWPHGIRGAESVRGKAVRGSTW